MIDLKMEKEEVKMAHVCVTVRTEYDIDPVTGEPVNVVSRVVGERISGSAQKEPSKAKKPKVTLESIAENYPVVTLFKSYYKMNKAAAKEIGVMNDNGELCSTIVGNRIRLQLTYTVNPSTKVTSPVIMRDDEEKLVGAQQVRDALSVSYSGQPNAMLAQFGKFFKVIKRGDGTNEIFMLEGYGTLLELLKSVGADIPAELDDELVDVNNDNPNASGDEFIPEEFRSKQDPVTIGDEPEISGVGTQVIDDDTAAPQPANNDDDEDFGDISIEDL